MSEALNSTGNEDVLSSIRRLVSDDLRPAGALARAPADGEKLLLTPALRVVSSEPAAAAPTPPIDAVLARVSAGIDQQSDDWESETGDIGPDAQGAPMAEDVDAAEWEAHRIDAYAEPVFILKTPEERAASAAETISGEASAGHEFAATLDEADAIPEAEPLPGWAQSHGAEKAESPAAEPWVAGTVEPDQAWADEAEAAVLQELASAAPLSGPSAEALEPEDGDDLALPIDEAMLREIVRDVLREELQGRLGERITRNIRKLVRAEIARVMASEELL
ncbi:MAG: hypothetical protein ACO22Z_06115 [Paracoccaceae bacterium]